jgi:hypothetical protein
MGLQFHVSLVLLLLSAAACQQPAQAGGNPKSCPTMKEVIIRASKGDEAVRKGGILYARGDESVKLHAVVKGTLGGRKVSYGEVPETGGMSAPGTWPKECPVTVQWAKVEALPVAYNNAYSAPPAEIETTESKWLNGWSVVADVHPTKMHDEYPEVASGYGTMRYKVTVTTAAGEVASPGQDCRRTGAICPEVFTLSYRPDDTYLGYLHELFNTPYIYGSKRIKGGHQSDILVGSDCADFAVYGKRRQRSRKKFGYTYTGGLYKLSSKRTKVHLDDEDYYVDKKNRRLSFTDDGDVRPGDLLNLPDGHVGVLVKDDGNGYLDTGDYLMHTLFREPEIVPIKDARWGNIDGKEVLRLKR